MAKLSEKRAKQICNRALAAATAPELVVSVRERREGHLRFAQGQPTTEGEVETIELRIEAAVGGRRAAVTGNLSDAAGIAALVAEAEELAALSPVDPEHMPPLAATRYLKVDGHDRATAKLGAQQRSEWVARALRVADAASVEVAGFLRHGEQSSAVATSAGAFAYYLSTDATLTVTCRTQDGGSGWAGATSLAGGRVDPEALTRVAAEKADLSREPQALDPGPQLVVLEAQAVADLLEFFVSALDRRQADEGRSWCSHPDGGNRIGEELFHTSIRLSSNPADGDHPARPFASDGQAHKVVEWISDGVLKQLSCSRFWADKVGGEPRPVPNAVRLAGQELDLLELIGAIDRGVLVTRFWYSRNLDPRALLVTGLTRDGTFLIEQGKLTTAVNNFRYNDSPLKLLRNVLALGRPQRVVTRSGRVMVVPPMVVKDFNFSSVSDAV